MAQVFVLGSLNMDYVVQVKALPAKGETVQGSDVIKTCGGKGANQAVACAKTGSNVLMIGSVGDDSDGLILKHNLEQYGIDTSHIKTSEYPSGCAFITIDNTDNQIVVSPGANAQITFDEVQDCLQEHAVKHDYFVTQFETPFDVVRQSLSFAKQQGLMTILNPSPVQHFDIKLLTVVDYLFVNTTEFQLICPSKDELNKILEYGCVIVHTQGDKGATVYLQDSIVHHEGFAVTPIDTTAAGDAFLGAFLSQLQTDKTYSEILQYANASGALATQTIGAQVAIPNSSDIRHFLIKKTPN